MEKNINSKYNTDSNSNERPYWLRLSCYCLRRLLLHLASDISALRDPALSFASALAPALALTITPTSFRFINRASARSRRPRTARASQPCLPR